MNNKCAVMKIVHQNHEHNKKVDLSKKTVIVNYSANNRENQQYIILTNTIYNNWLWFGIINDLIF